MNYLERISQSKDDREKENLTFSFEESEQQLNADILATKKEISLKKKKLEESKSKIPFSSSEYLETKAAIKGLEEGLGYLYEVQAELFPAKEGEEVIAKNSTKRKRISPTL